MTVVDFKATLRVQYTVVVSLFLKVCSANIRSVHLTNSSYKPSLLRKIYSNPNDEVWVFILPRQSNSADGEILRGPVVGAVNRGPGSVSKRRVSGQEYQPVLEVFNIESEISEII